MTIKNSPPKINPPATPHFAEISALISSAQKFAYQTVNTTLIDLYWRIGEYISRKLASSEWGEKVVGELASYIAQNHPNLRGFSRSNLLRMKQFYKVYAESVIVAPLVRQLPWSHNLMMANSKTKCDSLQELNLTP